MINIFHTFKCLGQAICEAIKCCFMLLSFSKNCKYNTSYWYCKGVYVLHPLWLQTTCFTFFIVSQLSSLIPSQWTLSSYNKNLRLSGWRLGSTDRSNDLFIVLISFSSRIQRVSESAKVMSGVSSPMRVQKEDHSFIVTQS